ncbi:MAG: hypothetical protein ACUVQT_09210 [bacterium]
MIYLLILFQVVGSPFLSITEPTITGAGGPDAYGYRWIDSDTAGGPSFNWIDIKGVGTQILGLADDNVVGPFSIGFEFPYYWYRVNSFYVGSNGYIAFGDPTLEAHPFQTLPNPQTPNNVLAPLMSDIDFTPQGTCWYWTNAAHDTCIIQYDSVRFWNVGTSLNTFQIILSKPDSTITFQYLVQTGTPGGGTNFLTVGIENVSGTVGLQYQHDNVPSSNTIHNNLAILFYPPESTSYEVHDIAVWKVMNDVSGGIFVYNSDTINLWAVIKNTGNQTETGFNVYCEVRNPSNMVVFSDTVNVPSISPGTTDSLIFTPPWIPTVNGPYSLKVKSLLSGDMTPSNDSTLVEVRVVTYPATLQYDNGNYEQVMAWNGPNSGWGNKFYPPHYPIRVNQLSFHFGSTTSGNSPVHIQLIDDDGPNGDPGTVIFDTLIVVTDTGWKHINISNHNFKIASGAFYVGGIAQYAGEPGFSMDTDPLFSMRGYEYTGSWAPHRDNASMDILIRADVELWPGAVEEVNPVFRTRTNPAYATPNPFKKLTAINFAPYVNNVKIYDVNGRLVRTLNLKNGVGQWNGCDKDGVRLNQGVYFGIGDDRESVKLILVK